MFKNTKCCKWPSYTWLNLVLFKYTWLGPEAAAWSFWSCFGLSTVSWENSCKRKKINVMNQSQKYLFCYVCLKWPQLSSRLSSMDFPWALKFLLSSTLKIVMGLYSLKLVIKSPSWWPYWSGLLSGTYYAALVRWPTIKCLDGFHV